MEPRNKRIWTQLCALVGFILVVASPNAAEASLTVDGSSSGVFINPDGGPELVTTGVGESKFTWGESSAPSSLSFAGMSFSTEVDQPFVVGMLDYFNGGITPGTGATAVDLEMILNITSPTGVDDVVLVFPFELVNRPNSLGPILGADSVFLSSQTANKFFNIGNEFFTMEIGFANATVGGFENVDEFFVLEDASASAEVVGVITSAITPEPSTFVLAILGLLTLGMTGRRRRRR